MVFSSDMWIFSCFIYSGWTPFTDKSLRIDQDIFVSLAFFVCLPRSCCGSLTIELRQVPAARLRKMVIGRNGESIRQVGIAARQDIEALLGRPVHLYLNVRVRS